LDEKQPRRRGAFSCLGEHGPRDAPRAEDAVLRFTGPPEDTQAMVATRRFAVRAFAGSKMR